MGQNDNWQLLLKKVAPNIEAALTGYMPSYALKKLSSVLLKKDDATEEEVEKAISEASPEQLAAIKAIDAKLKTDLGKLGVDLKNVSSSRTNLSKNLTTKDYVSSTMGLGIMLGFFGVLVLLMVLPADTSLTGNKLQIINIMLGSLGTMAMGVVSYYFGSSSGSKEKNQIMKSKVNDNI